MTGCRVLLALSSKLLLKSVAWSLRRAGFEVGTAADGLHCVAKLLEFRPDVLVINPDLPWGGGDGVLAVMSEDRDLAAIPVIALVSNPRSPCLARMTAFAVSERLLPPVPDGLLGRKIHEVVSRGGRPPAPMSHSLNGK